MHLLSGALIHWLLSLQKGKTLKEAPIQEIGGGGTPSLSLLSGLF